MKNQVSDCDDTSCKSEGVLSSCSKRRKIEKLTGVRPELGVWVLFVVVRGGCTPIERLKTEIYDRESRLQWYMVKGGVLRDF